MKKSELIELLADEMSSSKTSTESFVNKFIETVIDLLTKGEPVTLPGFGTFDVLAQVSRVGRNPQTGARIDIPARNKVRFKASKLLKDRINHRS